MPKEIPVGLGQFRDPSDDILTYIAQLGAKDFQMNEAGFPNATPSNLAATAK